MQFNKRFLNKLVLQTIAMPCHTNPNGDIFGGWIVSQMDLGAAIIAQNISKGRVTTVAIEQMKFTSPISVGDVVSCRGTLMNIGNTSMKIKMECKIQKESELKVVCEGLFTFVAINNEGRPRTVPPLE